MNVRESKTQISSQTKSPIALRLSICFATWKSDKMTGCFQIVGLLCHVATRQSHRLRLDCRFALLPRGFRFVLIRVFLQDVGEGLLLGGDVLILDGCHGVAQLHLRAQIRRARPSGRSLGTLYSRFGLVGLTSARLGRPEDVGRSGRFTIICEE